MAFQCYIPGNPDAQSVYFCHEDFPKEIYNVYLALEFLKNEMQSITASAGINDDVISTLSTWSSSKINARQAMFNISNTVGLGFATNFNTNSDIDVMRWINTQNKSYYDFMREITQHSCYSPYTFFTSFIDQYYVLNFVECRRLLSHGGQKTDEPQMIYNCIMPEMERNKTDDKNEDLNAGDQKLSYYFLTNSEEFKGWTNYIEEYYELNDGYSIMSD